MKKKLTILLLTLGIFSVAYAQEQTIDVKCGKSVEINAKANEGYRFVKWADNNKNYSRVLTFEQVETLKTLVANFVKVDTIIFHADKDAGIVEIQQPTIGEDDQVIIGEDGKVIIDKGLEIKVTAKPSDCYEFEKWDDGETNKTRVIKATGSTNAINYTAIFKQKTVKFTVTPQKDENGNYMGTITIAQN